MDKNSEPGEDFKPTGTIAFMALLFLLAALIWFAIYDIQVERHF